MAKYLLDTNAYFEILKYISSQNCNKKNENIEKIIKEECYISKLTKIEIISVIGKYARGQHQQILVCDRKYEGTLEKCGKRFIIAENRKRWSARKLHDWMKLEKEISNGKNTQLHIKILDINESVLNEAEQFISYALRFNFKSMDAMILGTAKAYSEERNPMIIVTADKGLRAGMDQIQYPFVSLL